MCTIGPYFSLEKGLEFNDRTLSRAKTTFEFRPLPDDEDVYTKAAVDSYRAAFAMLSILTTELEDNRNQGSAFCTFSPSMDN